MTRLSHNEWSHHAMNSHCNITVPAEIVDHILSFLQSDPETLKTCSESHPSLCQLDEPYLYSHILFKTDDESESEQCSKLTELFSKRPYIVQYIRSLEIRVNSFHNTKVRRRRLEEISTILPNLLALREITLDHSPHSFGWNAQPESFRLAFLDCLRLQSMQDVHINSVVDFPFRSALDGECKSIRSLTVRGGCSKPNQINNLDLDSPITNQDLPLKSLCLHNCTESFFQGFAPWFATCRIQLRSLEFFSFLNWGYGSFPQLLTGSSSSLTSLDLNLGLTQSRTSFSTSIIEYCIFIPFVGYYDFNIPPVVHDATESFFPVILPTLPHLEQLTIRATLHYISDSWIMGRWGFYSPIPQITQLISSNKPSLKRLILNLACTVRGNCLVQTKSLPWFSLSEVICTPLVHLLSKTLAFERSGSSSIQVDLCLGGVLTGHLSNNLRTIPLNLIHSFLSGSKELMQFVEQGRLLVTPPVPMSSNINILDCW